MPSLLVESIPGFLSGEFIFNIWLHLIQLFIKCAYYMEKLRWVSSTVGLILGILVNLDPSKKCMLFCEAMNYYIKSHYFYNAHEMLGYFIMITSKSTYEKSSGVGFSCLTNNNNPSISCPLVQANGAKAEKQSHARRPALLLLHNIF